MRRPCSGSSEEEEEGAPAPAPPTPRTDPGRPEGRGLPARFDSPRRGTEEGACRAGEEEEEVPPYSPREPTRRTRRGRGDLPLPGMDLGPSPRSRSADDEEEKAGAMIDVSTKRRQWRGRRPDVVRGREEGEVGVSRAAAGLF